MIDASKLPPGPPPSVFVGKWEKGEFAGEIKPPREVREAMERMRKGQYVTYWTGPTQYGSGQLEPKYVEDRATVANWTVKIFEEVKQ